MIAGRDTTAATLTFILYFLAIYPHVTDRLRKEVLETAGTAAEGRKISWEMVKDMKYLRAVINGSILSKFKFAFVDVNSLAQKLFDYIR